jgi:GNAT superfamily N-acetyltransferase
VGWIQVTPRAAVPALADMPRLRPVDDQSVWVITCLYVRVGYRRRGVTQALIEAAVRRVRRAKAAGVEAYPLDSTRSPSSTGCGYVSTFIAAGFTESVRRSAARPVMRKDLRGVIQP